MNHFSYPHAASNSNQSWRMDPRLISEMLPRLVAASMVFFLRASSSSSSALLVRGVGVRRCHRRSVNCAFVNDPTFPGVGRRKIISLPSSRPSHLNFSSASRDDNAQSSSDDNSISLLLQSNDVELNELNDNCLLALRRSPSLIAENALKAYVKQKRRREANGTEKISDPSNYIMAVLRNAITAPLTSADSMKAAPIRRSPQIIATPSPPTDMPPQQHTTPVLDSIMIEDQELSIIEEEASDSIEIMPVVSKKMMMATPKLEMTSAKFPTEIPQYSGNKRPPVVDSLERVTMEYVDECISCLAKLEKPIIELSGVGPKTEAAFHSLGLFTLRDFLWFLPRNYIDRSRFEKSITNVTDGEIGTFLLTVGKAKTSNTVSCTDETGNDVDVTFFFGRSRQGMIMASTAIQKFTKKGTVSMIVSGKVTHSEGGRIVLFNPDVVIPPDQVDSLGIEPVYSLSSGLTQKKVMSAVDEALVVAEELLQLLPESLPDDILTKVHWPTLAQAIALTHKPTSMEETKLDSPVRQRIAFEELSIQQARLALSRWNLKHYGVTADILQRKNRVHSSWKDSPLVSAAIAALPFNLTSYQTKCLTELWDDAIAGNDGRMLRLLQGDVGSGKTVMAYLLGLGCVEARQGGGRVVSIMCPTQLLAAQHIRTISEYAAQLQSQGEWTITVELLTGSVIGKSREDLLRRLETLNEKDVVFLIGTRALATPEIVNRLTRLPTVTSDHDSKGLALAIVDEEQRFGVLQRLALTTCAANSLFMSATPIPRSISLKRSALVDFTVLESEPRSVSTTIVSSDMLEQVLSVLRSKIEDGSKCFWVLPRIGLGHSSSDENEGRDVDSADSLNVISRYNMLKEMFGRESVCHVHGKMAQNEREEQVALFSDPSSKAAILVGTTVIEVGIDIPNTNILIVEDADRFGLSQLHQLRGRIGRAGSRSDLKCSCILLSNIITMKNQDGPAPSLTRLQILQKSNKGEEIADADFFLRGPGDMLGVLQSGIKDGLTVDLDNHWHLLDAATRLGRSFLQRPTQGNENDMLREESASITGTTIINWLDERDAAFYGRTSAAAKEGLALRIMMALFRSDESNAIEEINTLQKLDASKGEQLQGDEIIHGKFVEAVSNDWKDTQRVKTKRSDNQRAQSGIEEQVLPLKPYLALNTYVKRVNLANDDVMFVVLDSETTGLDDKSCHIIQLAAKVLGSDDEKDLFSEYILPPIPRIPANIEEMTGITDEFLRNGGYDEALGKERAAAREFRQVYLDFQTFCKERANGREIVFIAHNAKFDIRMINGELRRWRFSEYADTAPVLGEIFASSFDTLQLFRNRKWWRSDFTSNGPPESLSRPSSFSLSELHSHIFDESITNSHNAVGDVRALERLLLSKQFAGWESVANEIQIPFVNVDK